MGINQSQTNNFRQQHRKLNTVVSPQSEESFWIAIKSICARV